MKCFYCYEEIEDGAEAESETFFRNARAKFPELDQVTRTWHAGCEPPEWVDKDPHAPLCSEPWPTYEEDNLLLPLPPYQEPAVPWHARLSTWLCWNVTDRLRYWGLWPSRRMAGFRERFPVHTAWWDMWHWACTSGTCMVLGHVKVVWFESSVGTRYRCSRCEVAIPRFLPGEGRGLA